ncbi:MAG: hypothetical protein Q9217_006718, partial [Psora testacea]
DIPSTSTLTTIPLPGLALAQKSRRSYAVCSRSDYETRSVVMWPICWANTPMHAIKQRFKTLREKKRGDKKNLETGKNTGEFHNPPFLNRFANI